MVRKNAKRSAEQHGDASTVSKPVAPKPTVPVEASKPTRNSTAKSSSSSNFSLWFIIFLISSGCGFGFYVMFEQMKEAKQSLVHQVDTLKNEIEALSHLRQNLPAIAKAVGSIPEIKESIDSLKSEVARSLSKSTDVESSLSNIQQSLRSIENDHGKLTGHFEAIDEMMSEHKQNLTQLSEKLAGSLEKNTIFLRDSISVAETNIEGLSKDIAKVSSSSSSVADKVTSVTSTVASMKSSYSKLESELQDSKEVLANRITQSENSAREFEDTLSQKMLEMQKKNSEQAEAVLNQVVESKKLSESAQSATDDLGTKLRAEMKTESSNANTGFVSVKASVQQLDRQVQNIGGQLENLKPDADFGDLSDLRAEMKRISEQVAQATKIYNSVETTLVESTRKTETQIATITSHVRASKEDVSSMRDEITAINAALDDVQRASKTDRDLTGKLAAELELLKGATKPIVEEGEPKKD